MEYRVGIGDRTEAFEIPEQNVIEVMSAKQVSVPETGAPVVARALANPIGTGTLDQLVRPGQTVCIITSDVTRPLPTATVLPPVMDELHAAGVRDEDVLVAVALGSHRPQTDQELQHILGGYYGKLHVLNGDSEGTVHLGATKHGTPVDILREVMECDVRIGLGNVEYHYFAGYSGGAKALMPGVSTPEAIAVNHSLMVDARSHAGNMESPVRLDLEEACRIAGAGLPTLAGQSDRTGLDFIVNVVLDEEKQVVACCCGDFVAAHRAACAKLDALYGCELHERADIVVVSQGGAPKDLNLYQLQKALDNAKHPVREGGVIVLVGSCAEGFGNATFEQWMRESESPQDIIDRLRAGFKLGGHKAAAIAQIMLKASIYLVSDLDDATVRSIHMTPFPTVQDAVDAAFAKLGDDARVLIMPHGGSTLPLMRD